MYFTPSQIIASINELSNVHPFYGITYLSCKKEFLPVGSAIVFPLDAKTDKFLQAHHQLNPRSNAFFQPFKSSGKGKKWLSPDYSAKGLQSINTQTFLSAFIHERGSRVWGWSENYIEILENKLSILKKQKIPAFHLAVWLYRDNDWPANFNKDDLINKLIKDFNLSTQELDALFTIDTADSIIINDLLQNTKTEWSDLSQFLPAPPDVKPDQGGAITYLSTKGIGPADIFELYPAKRLSLITGDNGLGKSFLLEIVWWALTGNWASKPAYPRKDSKNNKAEIIFQIQGEESKSQRTTTTYNWKSLSWQLSGKRPTIAGLTIYARVDGSFAIWDPARAKSSSQTTVFSNKETWDGLPDQIEGLIRDWISWQNNPTGGQFNTLKEVLNILSPPDLGKLTPGASIRIPGDPREIPTLKHPYGEIPITTESAGVRRVITLAYLLVWSWHEHLIAAELTNTDPQRKMVVIIDEIEAHLHPRWQRTLLPALLQVQHSLSQALDVQYIIATHSPLVMASSETIFEHDKDKLFHLDMEKSGEISLKEIPFIKYGDVSAWLTSPVFELRHARSSEAETAIEAAKSLQLSDHIDPLAVSKINSALIQHLADDDKFWPRWVSFAERFGVAS